MARSTRSTRPNLLLLTATILSLSITSGALFFIVYKLLGPPSVDTGSALVESDSVFTGATVLEPPLPLSDFTLAGNDGQPLSLGDLRGKVSLVYFGYTNCPDFCPNTMNDFKRIKSLMTNQASQVNFVMVSVDGARDNPVQMREYLARYDESFLGMTGAKQEVERIGAEFGLAFESQPGESYLVDHSSSIYMLDQEGRLHTVFLYSTEPIIIAENVRQLLS